MLRKANQWEVLGRNVASLVRPPRTPRKEMRILAPPEISRLYQAAEGSRLETLWRVAIGTGMRLGEMLALKWREIDLERGVAKVYGTIDRSPVKGLVETEPKTKSSRRLIHLAGSVVTSLRNHRRLQNEDRMKLGRAWVETGYVFTTTKGTIVNPNNVGRRDFKPLLRAAGIEGHVRIHDLRHTAISLALSEGVPPTDVSQMAGHSSVATTLQLYAHALPEAPRRAAEAIESIVGG